jgi:catechol 2,3-dioxygenase-like lactoylglutathione lyase family enzyme
MTTALWLPFTVPALAPALSFYRDRVGLSVVDGWDRDGEQGAVLAAGRAFVELVAPGVSGPPPVAFEVPSVPTAYARMRPAPDEVVAPPHRYPRGHEGFEVRGPGGATVMVWSEGP